MTRMYGEHPLDDGVRVLRACITNQIARFAPGAYVRVTRQTGRGERDGETVVGVAAYFARCFREYFDVLGVEPGAEGDFLQGKTLLEYGPGDIPGVALLMIAHGADKVFCVDRFPLLSLSEKNSEVVRALVQELPAQQRIRAEAAVRGGEGRALALDPDRIEYLVRPSGLSGLRARVDIVFSRAVLEHVDDVAATFADMETALRVGGLAVHLVDLKSHGLHRRNPLDFLTWPQWLWDLMYSHKGVPIRWRVSRYRDVLGRGKLAIRKLAATTLFDAGDVAEVRAHLPVQFRGLSDADLAWAGFWLVCQK